MTRYWAGSSFNIRLRRNGNILAVPISDTRPSAQALQLQIQRAMSGEQRLLLAREMSLFGRELARGPVNPLLKIVLSVDEALTELGVQSPHFEPLE